MTKITIEISDKNKKNMDIRLAKINEKRKPRMTQNEYVDLAIAEKNHNKDWAIG